MSSVNKVIIIGNLGRDPEVKSFQSGGQIAELRVATSESWKDRQSGERRERTEWHTVKLIGDALPGIAQRFLRKGSKVYIEGALQTRKWQDQSGADRYSTEVIVGGFGGKLVMLDGVPNRDGDRQEAGNAAKSGYGATGGAWDDAPLDDDFPF